MDGNTRLNTVDGPLHLTTIGRECLVAALTCHTPLHSTQAGSVSCMTVEQCEAVQLDEEGNGTMEQRLLLSLVSALTRTTTLLLHHTLHSTLLCTLSILHHHCALLFFLAPSPSDQ